MEYALIYLVPRLHIQFRLCVNDVKHILSNHLLNLESQYLTGLLELYAEINDEGGALSRLFVIAKR